MFKEEINSIFIIIFFITLLVVLALVFLFVVFTNRKNKLINENLESALENQKKQHELELKALRAQMNPHFVHNSLNAIQYYIQQNDVETSEDYLAKFSKLMRQFFEFSRKQYIRVSEEISLLENYLQIEKLRFEEELEYQIIVDSELDPDDFQIPTMIIQPLVENAINHGLFNKKGTGSVIIHFNYLSESSFEVLVIDDGIGIKQAKKLNHNILKENESHSSAVLAERLHFLNQRGLWHVDYKIEDRSLSEEKSGTKVTLKFSQNINDED
ncbi:sensor histidine kinase [Algibacter pacificus]|uniref:sensor histidine kinase n=1 Tax=Algibacter pacificus TaxID=2599389 RepID=UPI0011CCB574|nr:histidine kinase [Algibacter pacificus]